MEIRTSALICAVILPWIAHAQSSTSYRLMQIAPGSVSGGGQVSSAGGSIVADISLGDTSGGYVSSVSTGGVQLKPNYIGQLTDATGLTISANPASINEGDASLLSTKILNDDATTSPVDATDIVWDFDDAIAFIFGGNTYAQGAPVYEDTLAGIEGSLGSLNGTVELTVLNTDADNYGDYGSDGLDDSWQVSYFGAPPNANAAPDQNPDGDPYDNAAEYLTGFSPIDGSDYLRFKLLSLSAGTAELLINKVIPNRYYEVKADSDLNGSFDETAGGFQFFYLSEESNTRIIDYSASGTKKFYKLEVTPFAE